LTRFGEAKQILPGSLLVLWQISFQLLYGLLDDAIAADLHLPLMEQAWLGLTFLVPYAAMQWRAGQLIDRWGAQRVLACRHNNSHDTIELTEHTDKPNASRGKNGLAFSFSPGIGVEMLHFEISA
jgi:hypothetical protein